ncbi:MAG: AAA family ATPase, partial [Tepidisphaeraceae bacterium]
TPFGGPAIQWAKSALAGAGYYRFSPRQLATPVAYDPQRGVQMSSSGFGLAICLDELLGGDHSAFELLEKRLKLIFPQITQVKLKRARSAVVDSEATPSRSVQPTSWGKEICISFSNSPTPVPASQLSDGILLALAYLAILHSPQPPRVLLIEEPETGIYPPLLQNIVKILRDIVNGQSHTQVIMTTHSPYVLDDFQPEDVTLCRKDADGSVSVHPLSKYPSIKSQLSIFSLGELWVNDIDEIANGAEAPSEEPAK